MPVQRALMLALAPALGGHAVMFSLVWGPAAILAPLIAAYALHRWVELPCWRWSRRTAQRIGAGQQALLFAKRSKNSHQPIDSASASNTGAAGQP
jgi:peptidoglycan/LPS O-acetylase OafA/YrhL